MPSKMPSFGPFPLCKETTTNYSLCRFRNSLHSQLLPNSPIRILHFSQQWKHGATCVESLTAVPAQQQEVQLDQSAGVIEVEKGSKGAISKTGTRTVSHLEGMPQLKGAQDLLQQQLENMKYSVESELRERHKEVKVRRS